MLGVYCQEKSAYAARMNNCLVINILCMTNSSIDVPKELS